MNDALLMNIEAALLRLAGATEQLVAQGSQPTIATEAYLERGKIHSVAAAVSALAAGIAVLEHMGVVGTPVDLTAAQMELQTSMQQLIRLREAQRSREGWTW